MNFKHLLGLYHGERIDSLIVCNIERELAEALGSRTTKVLLSADTMAKQRRRHDDLKPEDYMVLRPALLWGEVRLERPKSAMVLYVDTRQIDWGIRAHLKATENGRELYADSFCLLRRRNYRQALAKPLTILRPHK